MYRTVQRNSEIRYKITMAKQGALECELLDDFS